MNKLELLWELEERNLELNGVRKKIDDLNRENEKINIDEEIIKLNRRLEIFNNNMGVIKAAIAKYENSLSQYEYEIKVLNDKLYKDNITDIKQLEYLGFEKEQMNKKLKEVEVEMIAYMEEEEILEKKYSENDILLKEFEKKRNEDSSIIINELEKLKLELKEKEEKIEMITNKLDNNSLKEYNSLQERKASPIVLVKNNMCLGCYMKVPMYQLEGLRKKSDIINCESCGRILLLSND